MQWIAYWLLASNIAFLSIIICIQKHCGLSISDQPLSTWSEWEMTWPYQIPALSAGNLRHVDYLTSNSLISLYFLTLPHTSPSLRFPWCTISNYRYLNHLHLFCAKSYAVRCMDEWNMTVIIQTDLYWALNARSMTCMTSLTYILVVYVVTNIAFVFSINSNWQTEIELIGHLTTWFGFKNTRMVRLTFAPAQTNYHVSQFGHWNQDKADT